MLNNNESKEPTIAEFFANKNIFITGGTGFLGTVLIESLLSSSPDIGTIYVLIREKYGADANERIQRLLSKQVGFSMIFFSLFSVFSNVSSVRVNRAQLDTVTRVRVEWIDLRCNLSFNLIEI